MPRLSADNVKVYEGKLTMDECVRSLKSFESYKYSGNEMTRICPSYYCTFQPMCICQR